MKTIDINAREWFDKANGNSYFSARVTLDYGTESEQSFVLPFQYGYGDMYLQAAEQELCRRNIVKESTTCLKYWCKDNGIIFRSNIQRGCLKRELKNV